MLDKKYSLMIHGGIGRVGVGEDERAAYKKSIRSVLEVGARLLEGGGTALDIVEKCVSFLEDDPLFNAGRGSALAAEGKIECDAAIMDGRDLAAGAVARVTNIRNPVQLARRVMERSGYLFLVGDGALKFADEQEFSREADDYFVTERRVQEWKEARSLEAGAFERDAAADRKYGTVGAVARDRQGNLAAATSSGGTVNKKYGRVGDCPIIGAGTFAENNTCAVSATGWGEQIMRIVLGHTVADLVRYRDLNAQAAAEEAVHRFVERINGLGGVIVVDRDGRFGAACSTPNMIYGRVGSDQAIDVHV